MMISVPGEWDSYKLDQLHERLAPAYAAEQIVINLSGARHVTETLLAALLELRAYRAAQQLAPAVILVNSAFVRKLLSLAGFDGMFRVYDAVEALIPKKAA